MVVVVMFALPTKAYALSSNPASAEFDPGEIITLELFANPEVNESGIELRLQATGMTITGFTPASGFLISQGLCNERNDSFTATEICHVYGRSEAMTNGQSLGTITARLQNSSGSATLDTTESEYATSDSSRVFLGVLSTLTIIEANENINKDESEGASDDEALPATALSDDMNEYLYILISLTFFGLGALTVFLKKNSENKLKDYVSKFS